MGELRLKQLLYRLLPTSSPRDRLGSGHVSPQASSPDGTVRPRADKRESIAAEVNGTSIVDGINRPAPAASKPGSQVLDDGHIQDFCRPSDVELDSLEWGQRLNGPDGFDNISHDVESSPGSGRNSPTHSLTRQPQAVSSVLPSVRNPPTNKWRVLACSIAFLVQGLNDSAPGALLPYMEAHYHIRYAMVSLIFVANAVGFIVAAPICHRLNNRFGRAKVLSGCTLINVLAYVAIVCQPPFAVVVISFALLGYAFATILALNNVFIVNFQNGTVLLGYMHGCYGIGGIIAPFLATAMVSNGIRWCFFYFVPLGLSLVNAVAFFASFQGYETEGMAQSLMNTLDRTVSRGTNLSDKKGILKKCLKNRTTLLGALLIFAYQGAEVSMSGWVISFLIDYRNGDPANVGYVTSGFWGGITLGRFLLITPAHKIGDRISLIILIVLTAGFQLMLWFLPNIIGNAVAVAIVGILQGPIYPVATGVFSKLLPAHLQVTSIGLIGGTGSSGGAIGPLVTGVMAQSLGTVVLNPVCIFLYAVMQGAWLGLPRVQKRRE